MRHADLLNSGSEVQSDLQNSRNRLGLLWGSLALAAIALVLRAWGLDHSLWLDELHTAWVVRGPWSELINRCQLGNHGPVYFAAVKCLTDAWGLGETSLRAVSVAAGVGVVVGVFVLLRVWGAGWGVATAAAVACLWDPQLQWFAQEARPYAALQLGTLIHMALTHWAIRRRWSWWPGVLWAIAGATLLATHLVFVQVLVAEVVAALLIAQKLPPSHTSRFPSWGLSRAVALLALMSVPWWPLATQVVQHRQMWQGVFPPWPQVFQKMLGGAVPWIVALAAGGAAWALVRLGPNSRLPVFQFNSIRAIKAQAVAWPGVVLATCTLALGPVAAWGLTVLGWANVFFPRYLTPAHAAVALAWGAWCSRLPSRKAQALACATAVLGALMWWPTSKMFLTGRLDRWHFSEDWASALAHLQRHAQPNQVVLLAPGLVEERLYLRRPSLPLKRYLLFPLHGLYDPGPVLAEPLPLGQARFIPASTWRHLRRQRECWLVVRGTPNRATQIHNNFVREATRRNINISRSQKWQFSRITLWRINLNP